jgi:putative membrane protein
LAIFVAFRNQSAYARWWEARTLWGGIVNSSRILARLVITFADSHSHQTSFDAERASRFKQSQIYKMIAWCHTLRMHLRRQADWPSLQPLLSEAEYEVVQKSHNKPNQILLLMGRQLYQAMADGTLGGFDSFQIEGQLAALANHQGGCERIKNTPLPRQYDYFTRLFVLIFAGMLPFGLLGFFIPEPLHLSVWLIVPITAIIVGVFAIMERTGAAIEDPFEDLVTDVPLSALCNTIERDLREMLGETNLLPKLEPVDGYLQ